MVNPMSSLRRQANRASDWLVRAVLLGRQFYGRWKLVREQRALFQGRRLVMCWPTERHHRPSRRCNHGPYQFGALPPQLRREPHASRHVDEKSIRRGRPPKYHTAENVWRRSDSARMPGCGRDGMLKGTVENLRERQRRRRAWLKANRKPQVTWLVMGATARR